MSGSSKDDFIDLSTADTSAEGARLESAEDIYRATQSHRTPTAKELGAVVEFAK